LLLQLLLLVLVVLLLLLLLLLLLSRALATPFLTNHVCCLYPCVSLLLP
jgi:hypothetical protein